jgi:hypothetical protein
LENAKRKLAQLEGASRAGADTAGGTDGNTGGGSGELATGKRARVRAVGAEARAEGIEEMKRTVQAFAAAELDAMPEEDQVRELEFFWEVWGEMGAVPTGRFCGCVGGCVGRCSRRLGRRSSMRCQKRSRWWG